MSAIEAVSLHGRLEQWHHETSLSPGMWRRPKHPQREGHISAALRHQTPEPSHGSGIDEARCTGSLHSWPEQKGSRCFPAQADPTEWAITGCSLCSLQGEGAAWSAGCGRWPPCLDAENTGRGEGYNQCLSKPYTRWCRIGPDRISTTSTGGASAFWASS